MDKYQVLKIILDEKYKVDRLKTENELTEWFWKVGFRNIEINEDTKQIICEVSRPNQFIRKFRKPIVNFLIYLSEKVFIKLGYTFDIKKYNGDEYYSLYKKYTDEVKYQ